MKHSIIKRDGSIVEFDKTKIVNAIESAMDETGQTDVGICEEVADEVWEENEHHVDMMGRYMTVEQVQDIIEDKLLEKGWVESAKRYIRYRDSHKYIREEWKPYKKFEYLSDDFLRKYAYNPDPFKTQLGKVTFYRTYSRYLKSLGRRETFLEMNARVADYMMEIDPLPTVKKAEELFDYLFNMKVLSSGRIRYTGGTEAIKRNFQSAFNCSFLVMDNIFNTLDLMYLLMLGSGCGFRILKDDVKKIHPVRQDLEVSHLASDGKYMNKDDRKEFTTTKVSGDTLTIVVGDSKQGWVDALKAMLEIATSYKSSSAYKVINKIQFNYDNVRPSGEKLETFGGTASGFIPLKNALEGISNIFTNSSGEKISRKRVKLKPIDILDINCFIAEAIVVGGVRRSSMLAILDPTDEESINAKANIYIKDGSKWVANTDLLHRQMSNNSIAYSNKPTREEWNEHMKKIRFSGEPASLNYEEMWRRNPDAEGLNP